MTTLSFESIRYSPRKAAVRRAVRPAPRLAVEQQPVSAAIRQLRAASARNKGGLAVLVGLTALAHVGVIVALHRPATIAPAQPKVQPLAIEIAPPPPPPPPPPEPPEPPKPPKPQPRVVRAPVKAAPPLPVVKPEAVDNGPPTADTVQVATAPAPAPAPAPVVAAPPAPLPPEPVTEARGFVGYRNNPAPDYPALAQDRGMQGRVILKVHVLASGQTAITYAILTIAEAGDNIVSAATLYGGTYNLFAHTLPQFGIQTRFADYREPESFARLIDERTKAVYIESIGNPLGNITDIEKIAEVAHRHGVPLIVDNTVATPYLLRPFEHGADIVVHSLTKYLGGHGNSIGGIIVDSGKFPWAEHKERFRRLNEPDVSYHGVVYTEALGAAAYIGRARVVLLRNTGGAISPFNAFLILQGIETLALRLDRITENTLKVAGYLDAHPKVRWVNYAGLPDHPGHDLALKYLGGRPSGVLTFGVSGGREGGARFQDALQLFTRLVNIGDAKSLACHPASTTHRQLGPDELAKAGVTEDTVRLSIGIEHIDDLLADLGQALDAV